MDNVTHSLIGFVVGELSLDKVPADRRARLRPWFWWASCIANNFPDLDFLYSWITPGKLGYLLHHRGHTHTLLLGLPQGILVFCGVWGLLRLRKMPIQRAEWERLVGLCLLGPYLHIGLDGLNIYGIHPFWPWDNRWVYGDSLFIVEPSLWLLLIPMLATAYGNRIFSGISGVVYFGLIYLLFRYPYVPKEISLSLIGASLITWLLFRRISFRLRLVILVVIPSFVIALFAIRSAQVKQNIRDRSQSTVTDVMLSPFPANPFCWSVITLEVDAGSYRLRRGIYASNPNLFPVEKCPPFRDGVSTAPLLGSRLSERGVFKDTGAVEMSLTALSEYTNASCSLSSFLRFARAPFFIEKESTITAGDLRFDREEQLGFAEDEFLKKDTACPKYLPPWVPPRSDLF